MQFTDGRMKSVAFVSRTLNAAESQYTQIEKEALALVWTCEKFHLYLCGLLSFDMVTDHKPLIPLINNMDIDRAPLRCQRLLLRLFKYNPVARHVPGKQMVIADMISRHPLPRKADESDGTHQGVQCHEVLAKTSWPASDSRIDGICQATAADSILQAAIQYTRDGWPRHPGAMPHELKLFYAERCHLSECDGLLLHGSRIIMYTQENEGRDR